MTVPTGVLSRVSLTTHQSLPLTFWTVTASPRTFKRIPPLPPPPENCELML